MIVVLVIAVVVTAAVAEAEIERHQNHPDYCPAITGVPPVALWLYAATDRGGQAQSGANARLTATAQPEL